MIVTLPLPQRTIAIALVLAGHGAIMFVLLALSPRVAPPPRSSSSLILFDVPTPAPPQMAIARPVPEPRSATPPPPVAPRYPATVAAVATEEAVTPTLPTPPAAEAPQAPVQSAAPPGPAPVPSVDYRALLLAHLSSARRYPPAARAQRREGTVVIAFSINAAGGVEDVHIIRPSSRQDFDREAIDLVHRAAPMPPPPVDLTPPVDVQVPIAFRLRDRADARP